MARVNLVDPGTASGEAGALLKDIDQAFGVTPNMFRAVANSPAALKSMWGSFGALGQGRIDAKLGCQTARKVAPRSASNVDPLSMLRGEEAARRSWSGLRSRAGSGSVVCGELRACS